MKHHNENLKKFELHQVMWQKNSQFVEILTKIGNDNTLTKEELQVIESRFITKEEARIVCPEGIRLVFTSDVFDGCHNIEQENFVRQKLQKK